MYVLPMIGMPGPTELLLVTFLVLLFFGAGKLPEVFSSMGRAVKGFKDAQKEPPIDVSGTAEKTLPAPTLDGEGVEATFDADSSVAPTEPIGDQIES